jgi:hypothetical protein
MVKGLGMRPWIGILIFATVISAAAPSEAQPLTPAKAAAVEKDVRAFAEAVAHGVTQEGPAAWRKYLSDAPSFFLASEGRMVFANGAAATAGIQDLVLTIKHIELQWGDDLRVDPLTPDFAVVASSYREVRVDPAGKRIEETGFFTGTAEHRDGRWQFRNAHWSVIAPAPAAP